MAARNVTDASSWQRSAIVLAEYAGLAPGTGIRRAAGDVKGIDMVSMIDGRQLVSMRTKRDPCRMLPYASACCPSCTQRHTSGSCIDCEVPGAAKEPETCVCGLCSRSIECKLYEGWF